MVELLALKQSFLLGHSPWGLGLSLLLDPQENLYAGSWQPASFHLFSDMMSLW
jgi:hypothetical protein